MVMTLTDAHLVLRTKAKHKVLAVTQIVVVITPRGECISFVNEVRFYEGRVLPVEIEVLNRVGTLHHVAVLPLDFGVHLISLGMHVQERTKDGDGLDWPR